ncbi:MAG TPA: shikimate dehydrogenase [Chitinophagaceae bacterium]|jgi:shikimate dehydrogenase|nr:shikimate dehydrogenase [Chitinophagaceae bacterium]
MRLFGLIGYPLTHSFSKSYFAEKFKKEGIEDCKYENFPIASIDDLPRILNENPDLQGLNVTIPYKESILPFLDKKNDLVKQTGACNCIKMVNSKWVGYNTDVIGFERSLLSKLNPENRNALILGTGGAAKAVEFVLRKLGISYKHVSRYPSIKNLSYEQLTPQLMAKSTLIINTTPLGMFPKITEAPPLPYDLVTKKHLLFDLIYNPEKTLFLKKGEEQGAVIQNGYEMLIYQAEESWKIWNRPIGN